MKGEPYPAKWDHACEMRAWADREFTLPILIIGRRSYGASLSFELSTAQGAVLMLQLMQALKDAGHDPLPDARKWAETQKSIAAQAAAKGAN